MKKDILKNKIIPIVVFFILFFCNFHIAHATCTTNNDNSKYCLLAPLPGLASTTNDGPIDVAVGFGNYVNTIIRIVIGLMSVLAVVMIVVGGIQYMISDSGGEKNAGKSRIQDALIGIVVILSSYMILNTINPKLVNLGITIPKGTLTLNTPGGDGVADDDPSGVTQDSSGTPKVGGYVLKSGSTFENPSVTSETNDFVTKLKAGATISEIDVYAASRRAFFMYKDSSGNNVRGTAVSINIGAHGYSDPGTAVVNDKKTPLTSPGSPWHIDSNIRRTTSTDTAQMCHSGNGQQFNCGAAFIEFDSKNTDGKLKNTGFHGNAMDTLGSTAGCVRMYNDDLIALMPYMVSGIPVYILGQ